MTWPNAIAAAIGALTGFLILHHQHHHRSTTAPPQDPQDGEQR